MWEAGYESVKTLDPLALSFGKPPWCVLPLWGLLNLVSQLTQKGDSGSTVPDINSCFTSYRYLVSPAPRP